MRIGVAEPPALVLNFAPCGRLAFEDPTPEAHERMAVDGSPGGPRWVASVVSPKFHSLC